MLPMLALVACRGGADPSVPTAVDPAPAFVPSTRAGSGWSAGFTRFEEDPYDGVTEGLNVNTLSASWNGGWDLVYAASVQDNGGVPIVAFHHVRWDEGAEQVKLGSAPLERDTPFYEVAVAYRPGDDHPHYVTASYGAMVVSREARIQTFSGGFYSYAGFGAGRGGHVFGWDQSLAVFDLETWRNTSYLVHEVEPGPVCPLITEDGEVWIAVWGRFRNVLQLWRGTDVVAPGHDLGGEALYRARETELVFEVESPLSGEQRRCAIERVGPTLWTAWGDGTETLGVTLQGGAPDVGERVPTPGMALVGLLMDGRPVLTDGERVSLIDGGALVPVGDGVIAAEGSRVQQVFVSNGHVGATILTFVGQWDRQIAFVTPDALP